MFELYTKNRTATLRIFTIMGLICVGVCFLASAASAQSTSTNINATIPATITINVIPNTTLQQWTLMRGQENIVKNGLNVTINSDFIPVSTFISTSQHNGFLWSISRNAALTNPLKIGVNQQPITGTPTLLTSNLLLDGNGGNVTQYDILQFLDVRTVDQFAGNVSATLIVSCEPV